MFAVLTLIVYRICREHPSETINQPPCNGGCDGNPIYANHEHTKQRVRERILGSRVQFCAAFYHVHKWNRHRKRFCLAPEGEDNCIIAIRASSENNWKLQPKTVVAMVKYEKVVNGNSSILYEAKYTNCQSEKKHAEDFFKEDVELEEGDFASVIRNHPGGTITMYLTLQPCNWSTTINPEGTKVTRSNHSCCETLRKIFIKHLKESGGKLCVKPTHLCRLEFKEDDAQHTEKHVNHHGITQNDQDEHLRRNAVRGIKMLMRNGAEVSAMTEGDWEYLFALTSENDAQRRRCRRDLDTEIERILRLIREQVEGEQEEEEEGAEDE
jgi:hypothetical protein